MTCPHCRDAVAPDATSCPSCGRVLPRRADSPGEDATGGVIPYKNPPALLAYYLGLFSLFPFLGILLSMAAIPLGIIGLRRRKEHPEVKGSVHAWIGIGCGTITLLLWGGLIAMGIVVLVVESMNP